MRTWYPSMTEIKANPRAFRGTLCLAIVLATLAAYWQVSGFEFLYYDDPSFVFRNPHVYTGLSLANLKWAFTTLNGDTSYWHPLTWLSLQLDCQLFGERAGAHHLTNLWLHICNTCLLFSLLETATASTTKSALVAALFALHPLHTETVAWVSERKSLLCAFFWFLTTIVYIRYSRKPRAATYAAVLLLFAATSMAKPMAVTLPFTLVLLDFWPLRRFEIPALPHGRRTTWRTGITAGSTVRAGARLLIEKLPLVAMAAGVSWLTVKAQQDLGAMATGTTLSLRVQNALVAYFLYLRKMVWPSDLAVIYPLHFDWHWWQVAGAAAFLLFATMFAARVARRYPYMLVGWLWFLGTLVPMIGLIQVGSAEMADRYSYVSLIGVFILLTWGISDAFRRFPLARRVLPATALLSLVSCLASTVSYLPSWKNSVRLFLHATEVTERNYLAHYQLAVAYQHEGNRAAAKYHLCASIDIQPALYLSHMSLGEVLFESGDSARASEEYAISLRLKPDNVETHAALANLLENAAESKFRDPEKAVAHAKRACELTHYKRREFLILLSGAYVINHQYREAAEIAHQALNRSVSPDDVEHAVELLQVIAKKSSRQNS